jgi:hypothetical protein
MIINLWHNEQMGMWRWTLTDSKLDMHGGSQPELRDAMNDIANTVEYIISEKE